MGEFKITNHIFFFRILLFLKILMEDNVWFSLKILTNTYLMVYVMAVLLCLYVFKYFLETLLET